MKHQEIAQQLIPSPLSTPKVDANRHEAGAQLRSNFGFLCEGQGGFDIDAEISNSVLNLRIDRRNCKVDWATAFGLSLDGLN